MIFETERLTVRELVQEDFADLCEILQDAQTMYAYEHAFSMKRRNSGWTDNGIGIRKTDLAYGR